MATIRLLIILLFLKTQACYSQLINTDSLLNNFKKNIEIEQNRHEGVVAMNDETKISYYLLMSICPVKDLIKYTNDSNPVVRSYVFAGLLRRKVTKDRILSILDLHKNDTAKFTTKGADVVVEWTVKDFMQAGWRLKLSDKLPGIDYKKELERLRIQSVTESGFKGISNGLIDKKELLKMDSLSFTNKDVKVVSFNLLVGEKVMKSSTGLMTDEMKQTIESCNAGGFIVFDDIKVAANDRKVRQIASLFLILK